MYHTSKRRNRRHGFFAPSFNNIITEILNTPIHEVVKDHPVRYTRPATNILKTENGFELTLALPGMTKDQVIVDVKNDKLTIKSIETENAKNENTYRLREFNYAKFERVFTLQEGADTDNISASFENGLLKITVPTLAEAGPQKIEIA